MTVSADVVKAIFNANRLQAIFRRFAYKNGEIPRDRFIRGLSQHGVSIDGATKLANQQPMIKVTPSIIG
jgi:hypothetical protein